MAAEVKAATGIDSSAGGTRRRFPAHRRREHGERHQEDFRQRGADVTDYALQCFGGAGGQHACLIADVLGMNTVLVHPFAGVLSAYGMGLADVRALRERTIEAPLVADLVPRLERELDELAAVVEDEVSDRDHAERIETRRFVHLRYDGSDTALEVPFGAVDGMVEAYERAYVRVSAS